MSIWPWTVLGNALTGEVLPSGGGRAVIRGRVAYDRTLDRAAAEFAAVRRRGVHVPAKQATVQLIVGSDRLAVAAVHPSAELIFWG